MKIIFKSLVSGIVLFSTFYIHAQTTHVVTNVNDSGAGSLRNAISIANSGDTIHFNLIPNDTIHLTSGQLTINKNLFIDAIDIGNITVKGNGFFRIALVESAVTSSIRGFTIMNGIDSIGGGICNNGTLNIYACVISENSANIGGGIYNSGNLFLDSCIFLQNKGKEGAGVFNIGQIEITDCHFYENKFSYPNTNFLCLRGGALYNENGIADIFSTNIQKNSAFSGGGIYNSSGQVLITTSSIDQNEGDGIFNYGDLIITGSVISENINGRGINNFYGIIEIFNTAIFANSGGISNNNGVIFIENSSVYNNITTHGGGIRNTSNGILLIKKSTIFNNIGSHGGGIYNTENGNVHIETSTISGNKATFGAGIHNLGTLEILFSTFSQNNSNVNGNFVDGILNHGHIISSNTIYFNSNISLYGSILSLGYNKASDWCGLIHTTDQNHVINLNLGPLQNNGGNTFTHALECGSAAIDAGDPSITETDQRGEPVFGSQRDIGAYERQTPGNIPSINAVYPAEGCYPGAYILQANSNDGYINWYDAQVTGNYLWTGNSFTTPFLYHTTSFWAEADNGFCQSQKIEVTASIIIDTTVTLNYFTITSNTPGAQYQWLDCNNNFTPLSGQTGQSFTATDDGSYAVEITYNNCVDTSACINIINAGIDYVFSEMINIYPNPVHDHVNIQIPSTLIGSTYIISDLRSEKIKEGVLTSELEVVKLKSLSSGVYFIYFNNEKVKPIKIVKLSEFD
jgi:hypothetical protein